MPLKHNVARQKKTSITSLPDETLERIFTGSSRSDLSSIDRVHSILTPEAKRQLKIQPLLATDSEVERWIALTPEREVSNQWVSVKVIVGRSFDPYRRQWDSLDNRSLTNVVDTFFQTSALDRLTSLELVFHQYPIIQMTLLPAPVESNMFTTITQLVLNGVVGSVLLSVDFVTAVINNIPNLTDLTLTSVIVQRGMPVVERLPKLLYLFMEAVDPEIMNVFLEATECLTSVVMLPKPTSPFPPLPATVVSKFSKVEKLELSNAPSVWASAIFKTAPQLKRLELEINNWPGQAEEIPTLTNLRSVDLKNEHFAIIKALVEANPELRAIALSGVTISPYPPSRTAVLSKQILDPVSRMIPLVKKVPQYLSPIHGYLFPQLRVTRSDQLTTIDINVADISVIEAIIRAAPQVINLTLALIVGDDRPLPLIIGQLRYLALDYGTLQRISSQIPNNLSPDFEFHLIVPCRVRTKKWPFWKWQDQFLQLKEVHLPCKEVIVDAWNGDYRNAEEKWETGKEMKMMLMGLRDDWKVTLRLMERRVAESYWV